MVAPRKRVEKAITDTQRTVPNASLSGVAADLATAAGAASHVAQVKDADILVNNVGSLTMKPFAEMTMQNGRGILVRKQQKITGRPVTPLHKGHVGFLACSGMLNGFLGEGKTRHIAHWRSVKMWASSTGRAKAKERPSFGSGHGSAMN